METQIVGAEVTLQQLMAAFNHRIAELQQLILTRGAQVGEYAADLGAVDVIVRSLEHQLIDIKAHLSNEAEAISKARALNELSCQQQRRLQAIFVNLPARLPGVDTYMDYSSISSTPGVQETPSVSSVSVSLETPATKEKKGKGSPPRCYISADELASLSSYMRGRLTLEKVNAAIDEIATFAEANARLLSQRKKLGEDVMEKVLELREIAFMDAFKGKHFFLESDMRGSVLKNDHTGKSIITVLRHLGRISESRAGRQRAFALLRI